MKNNLFKKFTKGLAMLLLSITLCSQIVTPILNNDISICSEIPEPPKDDSNDAFV